MSKKKQTERRATSHLPWKRAKALIKCLEADGKGNTALMIAAGVYLGLRIGDILDLRWRDILADSTTVTEGKTKKSRDLQLHADFIAVRDAYLATFPKERKPAPEDYIFVRQRPDLASAKAGEPITVNAANKRFAKALDRYGIETENASTHTLRKTFGRRVWDRHGQSEAALVLLGEIFGHTSIAVTRRYLGITRDEIAAAYTSL